MSWYMAVRQSDGWKRPSWTYLVNNLPTEPSSAA
jgi:hypothetical protein